MNDEDVWFEPKWFGYGSGWPVRWQGWAVVATYLVAVTVAALTLAERHRTLFFLAMLLMSVPLMVVSARHTRGGWRWRWGGER